MRPGAIVVIGARAESLAHEVARSVSLQGNQDAVLALGPLSCVEILGCSMLERTIGRLQFADVDVISLIVDAEAANGIGSLRHSSPKVTVEVAPDVSGAITHKLKDYAEGGIEHSFVISANAYAEADLLDLFYFHREARQPATRAFDSEGPLDLWVVDCAQALRFDLEHVLAQAEQTGASYLIREYVKRVVRLSDLRQLAVDGLRGRYALRPAGREIRPGVWLDQGAEVHRRARIVAPAYIGRGSRICEDTLITRFSSVERSCYVDYGTVVEDSSILANTRVGIWLDVCHSIVKENKLFSLRRGVALEICDPTVLRPNSSTEPEQEWGSSTVSQRYEAYDNADAVPYPAPEAWRLGADLIQG